MSDPALPYVYEPPPVDKPWADMSDAEKAEVQRTIKAIERAMKKGKNEIAIPDGKARIKIHGTKAGDLIEEAARARKGNVDFSSIIYGGLPITQDDPYRVERLANDSPKRSAGSRSGLPVEVRQVVPAP